MKAVPELVRTVLGVGLRRLSPRPPGISLDWEDFLPRTYRAGATAFPVVAETPAGLHYMTTFFDVQALSPSGRFLALTRVPFIWRLPFPGDRATISIVDRKTSRVAAVYETEGWGAQLGANVQWGNDDETLFCNDVVDGRGTGVRLDLASATATILDGPVFANTPDSSHSFSADLSLINAGIPGYGIPEGLRHRRRLTEFASATEGVWKTDLSAGRTRLFLSIERLVEGLPRDERLPGGSHHIFNVKVNRQGTRILVVLFARQVPGRSGWPTQLMTCAIDGSDVRLALSNRRWRHGGHHPNWAPDGDHIVMNLRDPGNPMRFVRFRYDGSGMTTLAQGVKGSGHPSLDPSGRFLLADAYVPEGFADRDREVPIRLIDILSGVETTIARVYTNNILGPRRVDPHPVWSRDGRLVTFNCVLDGKRQVMTADVSALQASAP